MPGYCKKILVNIDHSISIKEPPNSDVFLVTLFMVYVAVQEVTSKEFDF